MKEPRSNPRYKIYKWYKRQTGFEPKQIRCTRARWRMVDLGYHFIELIGYDDKRYLIWSAEDTIEMNIKDAVWSKKDNGWLLG